MAGALTRLRAAHAGVEVSFSEAEPEGRLPLLREGELDLVLGFAYAAVGARDPRDFTAVPLLQDPALAVLPADHRPPGGCRRRTAGARGAGRRHLDRRLRALPRPPPA
jgi:hypothetical protein